MKPDIDNTSIDSEVITWEARKLTIGDSVKDKITFSVGQPVPIGGGNISHVVAIYEDREQNSYVVNVNHPTIKGAEVPWKLIRNPTKTVEIEYDVSKEAYPDESIEEQSDS